MYWKQLYVPNQDKNSKVIIRNYGENDFDGLIEIQAESFPPPFPSELWWNKEQLYNHINLFSEGALCVEVDGVLAGSITGLLIDFDPRHTSHTWSEITDDGYIRKHNPSGDTLYIVDICIRPAYRKLDLGKWLMQSMYEVVVHKGLDPLLGGGRMPGYHKVADGLGAEAYLDKVVKGELRDPVISFLLRCGRTPVAVEDGEVIGATEYRYYSDMNVAMTDFTIIGVENKGVGRFLAQKRQADLFRMAEESGNRIGGMFAEIYNPYKVQDYSFGGVKPMDPFVRREVLSHLGYRKLDFN